MSIHKLTSTNAFIAFDLEDAPSAGIVRSAPKILQGGATDLARSLTYAFATLEMKRGGASAGINAQPDERAAAVAAFVTELTPMAGDGVLALDAGKGVPADALEALQMIDGRSHLATTAHGDDNLGTHLAGLGPVLAAVAATGGLEGKRVAIEGFGSNGPALADAAAAHGASVVGIATTAGSEINSTGLDPKELRERWTQKGTAMVGEDADSAWKVFGVSADVLFAGSKMGAINHDTAGNLEVQAVVPHASIPFTARALAVMQRADVVAVPDFVSTSAPLLAMWAASDATVDGVIAASHDTVSGVMAEAAGHTDGLFLGACYRAETFLRSWRDKLPFGRPLAS